MGPLLPALVLMPMSLFSSVRTLCGGEIGPQSHTSKDDVANGSSQSRLAPGLWQRNKFCHLPDMAWQGKNPGLG